MLLPSGASPPRAMQTIQPDLFHKPTAKEAKLLDDWERCKKEHPEMLKKAAEIALSAKRKGWKRWSTKGVLEVLRWQTAINADMGLGLKVNNNHTAFMARDLMRDHPELDGFFETRVQQPRGIPTQFH